MTCSSALTAPNLSRTLSRTPTRMQNHRVLYAYVDLHALGSYATHKASPAAFACIFIILACMRR